MHTHAHTRRTHVNVCVDVGTSHTSSWHLNSAAPSKKWYIAEGKKTEWKKCIAPAEVSLGDKPPCWMSKVKTWNMCLNRCPHSALRRYVLLPESNKGRRGKSAQTYLHTLTVYSWASANVEWECWMQPNNRRCLSDEVDQMSLRLVNS